MHSPDQTLQPIRDWFPHPVGPHHSFVWQSCPAWHWAGTWQKPWAANIQLWRAFRSHTKYDSSATDSNASSLLEWLPSHLLSKYCRKCFIMSPSCKSFIDPGVCHHWSFACPIFIGTQTKYRCKCNHVITSKKAPGHITLQEFSHSMLGQTEDCTRLSHYKASGWLAVKASRFHNPSTTFLDLGLWIVLMQ